MRKYNALGVFLLLISPLSPAIAVAQMITIPLGNTPRGLEIAGGQVYVPVSGTGGNAIVSISRSGDSVQTTVTPVSALAYRDLAYNPASNRIYLGILEEPFGGDKLVELDAESYQILETITIGGTILAVEVNPRTNKAYVGRMNPDLLHIIDLGTWSITDITLTGQPQSLVISSWDDVIVGTTGGLVAVVDGTTDELTGFQLLGGAATDLFLHESAHRLYAVGDGKFHSMELGESLPLRVLLTIWTFGYMTGIAVNENLNQVYVSVHDGQTSNDVIKVIDPITWQVTVEIPSEYFPWLYLDVCIESDRLYVANFGDNSVSIFDGFAPASVTDGPNLPEALNLQQNYPNPFNPSTVIRYGLPHEADVTLEVFDLLGRRVAVLVEGTREAGSHNVTFESEALAGGLYFYRMRAGNSVEVKKMLLMR